MARCCHHLRQRRGGPSQDSKGQGTPENEGRHLEAAAGDREPNPRRRHHAYAPQVGPKHWRRRRPPCPSLAQPPARRPPEPATAPEGRAAAPRRTRPVKHHHGQARARFREARQQVMRRRALTRSRQPFPKAPTQLPGLPSPGQVASPHTRGRIQELDRHTRQLPRRGRSHHFLPDRDQAFAPVLSSHSHQPLLGKAGRLACSTRRPGEGGVHHRHLPLDYRVTRQGRPLNPLAMGRDPVPPLPEVELSRFSVWAAQARPWLDAPGPVPRPALRPCAPPRQCPWEADLQARVGAQRARCNASQLRCQPPGEGVASPSAGDRGAGRRSVALAPALEPSLAGAGGRRCTAPGRGRRWHRLVVAVSRGWHWAWTHCCLPCALPSASPS